MRLCAQVPEHRWQGVTSLLRPPLAWAALRSGTSICSNVSRPGRVVGRLVEVNRLAVNRRVGVLVASAVPRADVNVLGTNIDSEYIPTCGNPEACLKAGTSATLFPDLPHLKPTQTSLLYVRLHKAQKTHLSFYIFLPPP